MPITAERDAGDHRARQVGGAPSQRPRIHGPRALIRGDEHGPTVAREGRGRQRDRMRLRGERLTIDREGEPIAVLSPVGETVTWRKVAERLTELGFPVDGFADDVEAAQAAQPRPERLAWPR